MRFLPGSSGAAINVHIALSNRLINYFKTILEVRAYCSNVYVVTGAVSVGWISNMSALRKVVVVSGEA